MSEFLLGIAALHAQAYSFNRCDPVFADLSLERLRFVCSRMEPMQNKKPDQQSGNVRESVRYLTISSIPA
jgi:hypothetical protein